MHCHAASEQTPSITKKKHWALSAGLALLSFAGVAQAADFFPLAPGNNWTYQDAKTGATFKVEVAFNQIYVNDHVYDILKGFGPQKLWVRINEYGNLVYWDQDLEKELIVTAFEEGFTGSFVAYGRQCLEDGRFGQKRVAHDGPAGSWPTLEIQYQSFACADAGEVSEQYAENIGMVRRVVNTIAGPRTYDLIEAKIGRQTILSGKHGSFTVLADEVVNGVWKVKLRVEEEVSGGVKVVFPSSQEYDLRLSDDDGNILWSWSANKLFLQATHEKNFGGVWEETVEVPVPPGVGEVYRSFVLSAWLTTAPNGPQFAAATRVVVPGISPAGSAAETSRRGRIR